MNNKIEKFEDLSVWQNAIDLSIGVYNAFKENRDIVLKTRYAGLLFQYPLILQKDMSDKQIKNLFNIYLSQKVLLLRLERNF